MSDGRTPTSLRQTKPRYLRVRNWEKFQHYHNRPNAPYWIKAYPELLDSYEFNQLSEVDRGRLMRIWLLAGRLRNQIPFDPKYVARAISASKVDLQKLVDQGWLEEFTDTDTSTPTFPPASRHTSRHTSHIEEKERREEEKEPPVIGAVETVETVENPSTTDSAYGCELATARLLNSISDDADEGTPLVIRHLTRQLTEAAIARVTESLDVHQPDNRARYAVAALKDELAKKEKAA